MVLEGPYFRVQGLELTLEEVQNLFLELRERFEPQLARAVADPAEARLNRFQVGDKIPAGYEPDPALYGAIKLRDEEGDILEYGTFNGTAGWCWTTAFGEEIRDRTRAGRPWGNRRGTRTYTVLEVRQ
jgi:hypothetical protein